MRTMIIAVFLALAACGANEQSTNIAGTNYTTSATGDTAVIDGPRGKVTATEGPAAAAIVMPAFAPKYPGSTITSCIQTERESRRSTMITLTTTDGPPAVAEFYRSTLAKAGFEKDSESTMEEGAMLSAIGQEDKVSIIASSDEDVTSIVVTISKL